jgi:mRNA interferase YafQ
VRYRPHRLSGNWNRFWECHIEPDWLLIWDEDETALILVRTGTHADLFGQRSLGHA